jgi:hypothetical protein
MNLTRIQIGQQFGRLTAVGPETRVTGKSGVSRRAVVCLCECGTETVAVLAGLLAGQKQSCGCLAREQRVRNGQSPARIEASARCSERTACAIL